MIYDITDLRLRLERFDNVSFGQFAILGNLFRRERNKLEIEINPIISHLRPVWTIKESSVRSNISKIETGLMFKEVYLNVPSQSESKYNITSIRLQRISDYASTLGINYDVVSNSLNRVLGDEVYLPHPRVEPIFSTRKI